MVQARPTKDDSFFSPSIVLQVEGCLFSVSRKPFEDESNVFRDMFELPNAKDVVCDGTDEAHPLHLDGIKSDEFRAFLKVLYTPHRHPLELSEEEWLSVLKLANMWAFTELREQAIKKLDSSTIDAIRKIQLARKYEISKWIQEAFEELVGRENALADEEVERIGLQDAFKISRIRERKQARLIKHYSEHSRKRRCGRGHEEGIPRFCTNCSPPTWSEPVSSYEMREIIDDGCDRITFTVV